MAEFEIYRSTQNENHFVAIRGDSDHDNALGVRQSDNLVFHTRIPDDGMSRIAFDAYEASKRIKRNGFYAFSVKVEARENID